MPKNSYDYLEKYLPPHPPYEGTNRNWFYPITAEEIIEAQEKMGLEFPQEIKEFYREIGYGSLYAPHDAPQGYQALVSNKIMPPNAIADIMLGHESEYIVQDALEMLRPGDMPFFEIADSYRFLVLKPSSNQSNAVWAPGEIKIEDSFEKFIWRLYYESPSFYDDIIEKHYRENA